MRLNVSANEVRFLFKATSHQAVFDVLSSNIDPVSPGAIATESGLKLTTARACLDDFKQAGLATTPKWGLYKLNAPIIINLRNPHLDAALWRTARLAAIEIYCNGPSLSASDLGHLVGVTEPTAKRALQTLRNSGILGENLDVTKEVADELLTAEQTTLTEQLRNMLRSIADPKTVTTVLLAPAEHVAGRFSVLTIVADAATPMDIARSLEAAAQTMYTAASNITRETGATFAFFACSEEDVWNHLWGLVRTPSIKMLELLKGVVVFGSKPKRDLAKYFEHEATILALTDGKRASWVKRGILKAMDAGFAFTPYGIMNWRRKVPLDASIEQFKSGNYTISVISSRPQRKS